MTSYFKYHETRYDKAIQFSNPFRHIDDLFNANDEKFKKYYISAIYLVKLVKHHKLLAAITHKRISTFHY